MLTGVAAIQARVGGRIGAYMRDTQSGLELAFDAHERFAMCSTFKLMLAAAILKRVEAAALALDGRLPVRAEDMVPSAPITSTYVAEGSTGSHRSGVEHEHAGRSARYHHAAGNGRFDGEGAPRRCARSSVAATVERVDAAGDDGPESSARRVPADWQAGDKTGNGRNGAANDLLIAWPLGRSAVIGAVYMSESQEPVSALDRAHAQIGGLFAAAVARR